MGEYRLVMEDYDIVIDLDPKNPETYCNRGVCVAQLGKEELQSSLPWQECGAKDPENQAPGTCGPPKSRPENRGNSSELMR